MTGTRSVVAKLVVGSFSIAALLGILALLGGGEISSVQGNVLLTTLVVGVESLAVLCYLAVGETRRAWLGVVGGVVSLVPFGVALWLVWGSWDDGELIFKSFGVGLTLAASVAQACLLLGLSDPPRGRVRSLLPLTLALVAVLALMIVGPILAEQDPGDVYWRVLGIVAILDVLGTVLVIVLQRFVGSAGPAPHPVAPTAAQARLTEVARSRGTTPDALLHELLDTLERTPLRPRD